MTSDIIREVVSCYERCIDNQGKEIINTPSSVGSLR